MKALLLFSLLISSIAHAGINWKGRDFQYYDRTSVEEAKEIYDVCKYRYFDRFVNECIISFIKDTRGYQLSALNRTGDVICGRDEYKRITSTMNKFFISEASGLLSKGTQEQLVHQLISDISYLQALRDMANSQDVILCG